MKNEQIDALKAAFDSFISQLQIALDSNNKDSK